MEHSLFVSISLFIVGLLLIIKGGDIFVDAATWAADVSGIPKFIIGATVVSLATTLPELLVSLFASFEGKVDMAIGNAVGSVTANTAMIMAISIICLPAFAPRKDVGIKSILLLVSTALLLILSFNGELSIVESLLLLFVFAISMFESIKKGKEASDEKRMENEAILIERRDVLINSCKFVGGAAAIVIGADLMVDYGSEIARHFGVSEAIIGATLVAVGTSLPELVTTITAIRKKAASLSIGNIIGANVIDITLIMPLCSVLSGKAIPVTGQNLLLDIPACLLVVTVCLVPILIKQKYNKPLGFILLLLYIAYLYIMISEVYLTWL